MARSLCAAYDMVKSASKPVKASEVEDVVKRTLLAEPMVLGIE